MEQSNEDVDGRSVEYPFDLPAMEDLLRHGTDMITVVDADGRCTYASPALVRMSGYTLAEVLGRDSSESMHPDDRDRVVEEGLHQLMGLMPQRPIRFRQVKKDGTYLIVEAVMAPLPDDHPLGVAVINTRDISDRESAELAREEANVIIRKVAEGRPLNEVLHSIVASFERQFPGATIAMLRVDSDSQSLRMAVGAGLPPGFQSALDGLEIGPKAGSAGAAAWHRKPVIVGDIRTDDRWEDLAEVAEEHGIGAAWANPVLSSQGEAVLGVLCLFWDSARVPSLDHVRLIAEATGLTTVAFERYRIEGELAYQATHDSLTGLPNRSLLWDRVDHALALQRRQEIDAVSLLFIDLDGFKAVNDTLGHAAGDQLLVQVAGRLESTIRDSDTVARFGGDEFVVLCNSEGVDVLAGRLNEAMTAGFDIDGKLVHITCSIGVASSMKGLDSRDHLMHLADRALYRAKADGKNQYVIAEDREVPGDDIDIHLRG